jgi:hypothetical protein
MPSMSSNSMARCVGPTRFDQQNLRTRRGELAGQHTSGGARTDDDIVVRWPTRCSIGSLSHGLNLGSPNSNGSRVVLHCPAMVRTDIDAGRYGR